MTDQKHAWTAEPPTEPGRYWAIIEAADPHIDVVEVERMGRPGMGSDLVCRSAPLDEFALWWPVPITPPPAPEEKR